MRDMLRKLTATLTGIRNPHVRPPGADLGVRVSRDEVEAEWRFYGINEANRKRGCPCGWSADVAQDHHEVLGTIPYKWWTCVRHEGAVAFMTDADGGPFPIYPHDRPCPTGDTRASRGPLPGGSDEWLCPHRTHEEMR